MSQPTPEPHLRQHAQAEKARALDVQATRVGERMIEVLLNGRIGNCLFQYAAARALAARTGTAVLLNLARYTSWRQPRGGPVARALRFFTLQASYTRLDADAGRALERLGLREAREDFHERAWGYDRHLARLGAATRLCGYFQSPRYWTGIEQALRAELEPRQLPNDSAFERALAAIRERTAVSVHVRRGDYLTTERALHGVCTPAYYAQALHHMRERVSGATLFLFSDDVAWCRDHFKDRDVVVVDVPASIRQPALDLYLMSLCRHHVISNSTYSWWGAWLNRAPDKIVCTPERWFNDALMNTRAMRDTVPSEWLRITV